MPFHDRPICREGEHGDKLYVIASGLAGVLKNGRVVATLGPGKVFGEIALMQEDAKRTASVVAKSDVVLLSLSRARFHEVMDEARGASTRRGSVVAGGHDAVRAHTQRNLLKDERRKTVVSAKGPKGKKSKKSKAKRKNSTGGRRRRKSRLAPTRTKTQQTLGGLQAVAEKKTEMYEDEDGVKRMRTVGMVGAVRLKMLAGRARRRVQAGHD